MFGRLRTALWSNAEESISPFQDIPQPLLTPSCNDVAIEPIPVPNDPVSAAMDRVLELMKSLQVPKAEVKDDSIDLGLIKFDKKSLGETLLQVGVKLFFTSVTCFTLIFLGTLGLRAMKQAGGIMSELANEEFMKFISQNELLQQNNITAFIKPNSTLSSEERELLPYVFPPTEIKDDWSLLGGLDDMKRELWDTVQYEMKNFTLNHAIEHIHRTSKSVLIYGPPGCGTC